MYRASPHRRLHGHALTLNSERTTTQPPTVGSESICKRGRLQTFATLCSRLCLVRRTQHPGSIPLLPGLVPLPSPDKWTGCGRKPTGIPRGTLLQTLSLWQTRIKTWLWCPPNNVRSHCRTLARNRRRLPYHERVRLSKTVLEKKAVWIIREGMQIATLNTGTWPGETKKWWMSWRKVDIRRAQGTKWKAAKLKSFRRNRGTTDMSFAIRQLMEKGREQHRNLCIAFVDFTKAFDSVNRNALWVIMQTMGCPPKFALCWSACTETWQWECW